MGLLFSRAARAVGLAAVLTLAAGCAEPEPTFFSKRQPIPFGSMEVTVSRVGFVSRSYLKESNPAIAQAVRDSSEVLEVYFEIEGEKESDLLHMMALFIPALKLTDQAGGKQWPILVFPADSYYAMRSAQILSSYADFRDMQAWLESFTADDVPRDWVALFAVPEKAGPFSLSLRNSKRLSGQPELAVVPLGR